MKKNLRIVSVAAAALLAVAPVAAGVVPAANVATTVNAASTDYTAQTGLAQEAKNVYSSAAVEFNKEQNTPLTWSDLAHDAGAFDVPTRITAEKMGGSVRIKVDYKYGTTKINGHALNEFTDGGSYGLKYLKNNTAYTETKTFKLTGAGTADVNALKNATVAIPGVKHGKVTFDANGAAEVTIERILNVGNPSASNSKGNNSSSSNSNGNNSSSSNGTTLGNVDVTGTTTNVTLGGISVPVKGDITVKSNLVGVTTPNRLEVNTQTGVVTPHEWDGKLNGTIVSTINGQDYTANFKNASAVDAYTLNKGAKADTISDFSKVNPGKTGQYRIVPGKKYYVRVSGANFNLGASNGNKKLTIAGADGVQFIKNNGALVKNASVTTGVNGGLTNLDILVPVVFTDTLNGRGVAFYEKATNNNVQNGTLELSAVNTKLNVAAVLAAFNAKYAAHQVENGTDGNKYISAAVSTTPADIKSQLEKQNISVDANGTFEAPKSFTLNFSAKVAENGAETTMPVTVSVPNGKEVPAAQETTKTITIKHISTVYDKNGVATHEPALRAYDTYSVVAEPVTLKKADGKDAGKFYKLAGKDQYIKVGNVDGTSRSLKHNSYVYKSTGKRRGKTVLKKGSSVTTYGKSFMIAGHQMYRIGKNQYVKKANF